MAKEAPNLQCYLNVVSVTRPHECLFFFIKLMLCQCPVGVVMVQSGHKL